ncbi:MAG: hypothetical protein AB4050_10625 [Synechococcus sp.]
MDLILHVGQGKTGTTSIQKDLRVNAKLLLKSGILYHTERSHLNLIYALGGNTRAPREEHYSLKNQAQNSLREIRELALKHNVRCILMSAENLLGISEQQQKILLDSIDIKFSSIKVIAYIRRPADFYLSLMQQRVKADHIISNPLEFKIKVYRPLERWISLVGKDCFSLQAFDKRKLSGGDVVLDFYKRLEDFTSESLSHLSHESKNKNLSLSSEQMILLQNYRRDFLAEHSGYHHTKSNNILFFFKKIHAILSENLIMTKPVLKPVLDSVITVNNRKPLMKIDKLFDTDLSLLFEKDFNPHDGHPGEQENYTDISQIVESYDLTTLDFFRQILPEYNKDLNRTSGDFSIPTLILDNPILCLHYSRFLREHSEDCHPASKYLLEHSFQNAIEIGITDDNYYRGIVKDFLKYSGPVRAASVLRKSIQINPKIAKFNKLLNQVYQKEMTN